MIPSLFAFIKAYGLLIVFPIFLFSFIYWLLTPLQREWVRDYLIPIGFFLILTGRTLWKAISILQNKLAKRSFIILLSINNLLVLIFMVLTIFSYIIRSKPLHRAVGFKERLFPLFVVIFHLVGAYLLVEFTKFNFNAVLYTTGLVFSMIGITLDCSAIWQLKRSFSIMVEIRPLITGGIYGWIRHPLYAGEMIHFLGIAMLFNNIPAYGLFGCLLIMQTLRAILEEKKLTTHVPEYGHYRKRTGFFWPRLRRTKTQKDIET